MNQEDLMKELAILRRRVAVLEGQQVRFEKTEEELRESEEALRSLFENSPDAILLTIPDGTIIRANPAACLMLDRSEQELSEIGRDGVMDLADPRLPQALEERARTGFFRGELNLKRKNGNVFPAEVSSSFFRSRAGDLRTCIIFRDLSEFKKAEEALRESERRLSMALAGANFGIWEWDLTTGKALWDERTLSVLGYESNEFESDLKNWKKLVHPEDWPRVSENLNLHLNGKLPSFEVEYRLLNKSGDWQWALGRGNVTAVDADGKPTRMAGVFADITDRKKAEEALRNSEAKYRFLTEHGSDLIWTLDLNLRTTFVTPSVEKVLGFTPEERMLQEVEDQLTPESLEYARQRLLDELSIEREQGIQEGKSVLVELDYYHKNGSIVCLQTAVTFIRDEKGIPIGLHGISRDITELKRTQEALRESAENLAEAQRVARIGNWSHDIRKNKVTWSDELYRIFGIEKQHFDGQYESFVSRIHPDDQPRVLQANARARKEGSPFDLEYRITTADGQVKTIREVGYADQDEMGTVIRLFGTGQDITERKEAEEERDRILNMSYDLICIAGMDGYFKYLNPSWERVLGYTREELLSRPFLDFIYPEDHDRNDAEVRKLKSGQETVGFENRYVRRDGSIKTINWTATSVPEKEIMYCIGRDVTQQKRAEEELQRQVSFMESLLEAIPAPVFFKNTDHVYIGCNEAFAEFIGRPKANIIGKSVSQVAPKELADVYKAQDEALFRNPIPQIYESSVKSSDGTTHDVMFHKATFADSSGVTAGLIGVILDITERKRMEEALRESREQLQTIFETSPAGIILVNPEGLITFANQKMGDLFSRPCEDLLGTPYVDLVHPSQRSIGYGMMRSLMEGEIDHVSLERRYVAQDGGDFVGHLSGRRLLRPDGGLDGLVGIITDITDRKAAEESLHETMELMQYIVRNDPNAIAVYDRDLHYLAVSNRYLLDYNVKEEDIIGKHHYEVFPEMPQRWKDVHQRCLLGAVEREDDDYFERPDGSITYNRWECRPWYRSSGEIGGIITYTEVTTERKMAEKALKESEARYRHLFDNSPVGILSVDAEGRILEVNQMLLEVLGSPSVAATKAINMFELPNLVESGVSEAFQACTTTGERVLKDIPYVSKWGKQSHLRIVLTPMTDREGIITGCQAMVEDITQQRELEDQLRQAQKMEAVGTLAGGIAHDFNNLLHIISGHAELLDIELAERKLSFEELDAIRQAAHRGADLVKQILTFSRRIDAKFESINLNEEVRSTERLLYRTIPRMIEIDLRLEEGLDRVRADSTQIEQMLINLAVNAKDAMPEGGRLALETRNVNLDEHYCKSHAEIVPGQYVLLKVSDTGHGMEEDVRQHIFEPFFTTKGLADGTGLGLATVFGIVKMHGGHITCESEVGKGTTFLIYFPAVAAAKPEIVAEREVTAVAGGTETILVVDDEPMIRDLAKRILEKSGYSVLTAGSGKEGIEVYAQHKSDIALVILDLIMPEMGGKQCLQGLLALNPSIKVIIASGLSADGPTKDALSAGAKRFVNKPYDIRQVREVVREVLDEE